MGLHVQSMNTACLTSQMMRPMRPSPELPDAGKSGARSCSTFQLFHRDISHITPCVYPSYLCFCFLLLPEDLSNAVDEEGHLRCVNFNTCLDLLQPREWWDPTRSNHAPSHTGCSGRCHLCPLRCHSPDSVPGGRTSVCHKPLGTDVLHTHRWCQWCLCSQLST